MSSVCKTQVSLQVPNNFLQSPSFAIRIKHTSRQQHCLV